MPIVLARVDNRLVHGQVLSAWVPALEAEALVVLDDEAARNTLVRSAMAIAIPPDVTFEVAPVARGAETLARLPPAARVIVLWRDVADAEKSLTSGVSCDRLNLGNVHFSVGRLPLSQAVYLSPEELSRLEALEQRGVTVELRTLPRDPATPLADLRRRLQAAAAQP